MILDATNPANKVNSLAIAAKIILEGGLVGVPTETVYGLASNALNPDAVRKIFEAKGRPFIDPLIVHVYDFARLEEIACANDSARKLAEKFSPGAITYVLPKKPCIPDIVSAGMPTVAVRIPSHPIMREFMKVANVPLSAPSANPFGYVSPTLAQHVECQLGSKIGAVIDGGACECGVESTIVMLTDEERPMLLRAGPIPRDEIEKVLGKTLICPKDKNPAQPSAPGMLKSHYAPRAKLYLFDSVSELKNIKSGSCVIYFTRPKLPKKDEFWLSENADMREAAHNLFALIRTLDKTYSTIFCQRLENRGIGEAVNDRLSRASYKG